MNPFATYEREKEARKRERGRLTYRRVQERKVEREREKDGEREREKDGERERERERERRKER